MKNMRNISTSIKTEEIILNARGESIHVLVSDSTLLDRFVSGYKAILEKAEALPKQLKAAEEESSGEDGILTEMEKVVRLSKINVTFSEECVSIIDGIFGEETVKKYFRDIYDKVPSFLPNAECIIEFFENMTPVIEELFSKKIETDQRAKAARMAKYKPQDHLKAGGKH